jgi:hypothetical protein
MKTLRVISIFLTAFNITSELNGQAKKGEAKPGTKTETFEVKGNCGMCKSRIENGLKMEGVTSSVWDKHTKKLTASYDPSKVTIDDMKKMAASPGHDTLNYRATDDVYAKLPDYCHCERDK